MLKFFCKKVILTRVLIVFLICCLAAEFIRSYQIINVSFSRYAPRTNHNYDEKQNHHQQNNNNPTVPFRIQLSANKGGGEPLVDLQAMPACPKTYIELFGNSNPLSCIYLINFNCIKKKS